MLPYQGQNSTYMHRACLLRSFANLLQNSPQEMQDYLLEEGHSYYGMQHRLFQEYISLLESRLPFSFSKKRKSYCISSLLDDNLNVFDGISIFEAEISETGKIGNLTKEFYIGSRKSSYAQPYYIGKLLDVVDMEKHQSIVGNVSSYSFSNIRIKGIASKTKVQVSHLRIAPHYSMGALAHLNRIRKKLISSIRENEAFLEYFPSMEQIDLPVVHRRSIVFELADNKNNRIGVQG